jgi:hypothetical protein
LTYNGHPRTGPASRVASMSKPAPSRNRFMRSVYLPRAQIFRSSVRQHGGLETRSKTF